MVLRNRTASRRDLRCALPIRWYLLPSGQLVKGRNHTRVYQARTNAPQWSGEEAPVFVRAQAWSEAKACGDCILYGAGGTLGG